jgi:autotransporter-associated beta strand protein
VVASGATLDLNGFSLSSAETFSLTGAGASGVGALANSHANTSVVTQAITLASNATISGNAGNVTLNGTIAGGNNILTLGGATGGTVNSVLNTSITSLTKSGAGTWALAGGNTYTGGTRIEAGKLSLVYNSANISTAANALGPSGLITFAGGSLQPTATNSLDYSPRFDSAGNPNYFYDTNGINITLSSLPAGTGTLTKAGLGTLTLVDALTRFGNVTVGATTISGGTLNLMVTHPNVIVSQAVFNGAGTLSIEPSNASSATSFTSAVTTSADLKFNTGGTTLGGLIVGKTGNTANITLNSLAANLSIAGSQTYIGGTVTIPTNATSSFTSWNSGGVLTLSGIDAVNIWANISVTGNYSGVAIRTSQNSANGSNVSYYNFGLSETGFKGKIDFDPTALNQTFSTQDGTLAANLKNYTLINSLAELNASVAGGNYALISNIEAQPYFIQNYHANGTPSTTTSYSSVRDGEFTGRFAGLGHTITNLTLSGASNVGLFSQVNGAIVQDIRLEKASIAGNVIWKTKEKNLNITKQKKVRWHARVYTII